MAYQPIEELLPKAGYSIYSLVKIAATRAVQLADGQKRLVDLPAETKTATVALEEVRQGKVVLGSVAEQFKPVEIEERPSQEEDEG